MKLSVFAVCLADRPLKDALAYLKEKGVQAVEIGCGGFPGKAHCDPEVLLSDPSKLAEFKAAIEDSGIELAALSTHGNCVHPDPGRGRPPLKRITITPCCWPKSWESTGL